MKIIFLILFSINAWSWTIKQELKVQADASFVNRVVVSCPLSSDTFCQELCQDQNLCEQEEPLCLNCAGSANSFMKMVFVALPTFYQTSSGQSSVALAKFLKNEDFVIVTPNSLFNFYTAPGSELLKNQFISFCPANSKNPIFYLKLDSQHEPYSIEFVSCQVSETESLIFKTEKKTLIKQTLN